MTDGASMVEARGRWVAALVAAGAFLGTAYAPLLSVRLYGLAAVFDFFAGDAFYYLAVAEHSIGKAFYTFDGVYPTNGFHPLWQYYLRTAFEVLGWQGAQGRQLLFAFYSGVGFTATGTALFALSLLRLTRRPVLAVLGVLPGAYYLLFGMADPSYGTAWSFVNGMESSLTVLFGGVLIYYLVGRDTWGRLTTANVAVVSLGATLLVLSRLDDVFIFVPLLLFIAARSQGAVLTARRLCVAAAIPTVLLGGYLLYNLATAGTLLPTSGMAKAQTTYGGLAVVSNMIGVLHPVSPPRDSAWSGATWRVLQMVVPLLVAGLWLGCRTVARTSAEHERPGGEAALRLFAWYVLIKASYNLVNVRLWDQGHWYYPLSLLVTNVILALCIHRALRPQAFVLRKKWTFDRAALRPYLRPVVLAVVVVLGVGGVALGVGYLLGRSQEPILFHRYSPQRLILGLGLLAVGGSALWLARPLAFRLAARSDRFLRGRTVLPINLQPLLSLAAVLFVVFAAHAFVHLKQARGEGRGDYRLWAEREVIAERLRAEAAGGVIELGDGVVSYALPQGAMNGFGLALDREAFLAWKRGELLDVAYERGYRLLAGAWYVRDWPASVYEDPGALRAAVRTLMGGQLLDRWTFRPVYVDEGGRFAFIRFEPAPAQ